MKVCNKSNKNTMTNKMPDELRKNFGIHLK